MIHHIYNPEDLQAAWNENHNLHGECIWHYGNQNKWLHLFYRNGVKHGEVKSWELTGEELNHFIFQNDEKIFLTDAEKEELNNVSSKEEHLLLKIRYGVPLFSDSKWDY